MLQSIKAKAYLVGASLVALGLVASTAITQAVTIDATTANTMGTSVLTTMQNAAEPVLVAAVVVIGALIGLYFIIRFVRRHVR